MTDQHTNPKSDIEIAQAASMKRIAEVASDSLGIDSDNLEPYGHYKAKLSLEYIKTLNNKPDGKLILVTAIPGGHDDSAAHFLICGDAGFESRQVNPAVDHETRASHQDIGIIDPGNNAFAGNCLEELCTGG